MDKIENLLKIKKLYDDGLLTEIEFNSMKNDILNDKKNYEIIENHGSIERLDEASNSINGKLKIIFSGMWFVFDVDTKLYIDNKLHSTQSTKKGFNVEVPINSSNISVKVVLLSFKSTEFELTELDKSKNYVLELFYDRTYGKYSNKFKIIENG